MSLYLTRCYYEWLHTHSRVESRIVCNGLNNYCPLTLCVILYPDRKYTLDIAFTYGLISVFSFDAQSIHLCAAIIQMHRFSVYIRSAMLLIISRVLTFLWVASCQFIPLLLFLQFSIKLFSLFFYNSFLLFLRRIWPISSSLCWSTTFTHFIQHYILNDSSFSLASALILLVSRPYRAVFHIQFFKNLFRVSRLNFYHSTSY